MNFTTGAALLALCGQNNTTISEEMRSREALLTDDALARMRTAYGIMKHAVHRALTEQLTSMGGLIGGEAQKLQAHRQSHKPVCGTLTAKAISYAMGVLEVNASMGLIVAAPTAGSSGVIPGVFLALQEEFDLPDDTITDALFNTGAIGYLFTRNATVAGAEGGCQAEVGAASAMAASGAVQLLGGTPEQCLHAAALAMSNLLGLVCDPIAGLVEAPCQSRNAIGASNALICAEMALSGIKSIIPFDEMLGAMYRVGRCLPSELRETSRGGCAATPTGCRLQREIFKQ